MAHRSETAPLAVIAGGSSGMGLATAMKLREQGVDLLLLSRNAEKLERAKAELSASGPGEIRVSATDL